MYRDVWVHTHKPHDHIISDLLLLFFNVHFLKRAPRFISAFISKINLHARTQTSEIATKFQLPPSRFNRNGRPGVTIGCRKERPPTAKLETFVGLAGPYMALLALFVA